MHYKWCVVFRKNVKSVARVNLWLIYLYEMDKIKNIIFLIIMKKYEGNSEIFERVADHW